MKRLDRGSRRSPQGCAAVMKWAQKTSPVPSRAILACLVMHPPVAIFFLPGAWSGLSPHQLSLSQTPPALWSLERDPGAHVASSAMALGSVLSRHSLEAARAGRGLLGRESSQGLQRSLGPSVDICQNAVATALRIVCLWSQSLIFQQHRTLQQRTPAWPETEDSVIAPMPERRERDQRSSLGRSDVTIIVVVALVVKNPPASAKT